MAIIADIANAGASAVGGGVLGLVGSLAGRFASYFERRQIHKHEIKKMENQRFVEQHQIAMLEKNMQAADAENEHAISLSRVEGSQAGLQASITAEGNIKGVSQIVNDVRGLTRPSLTLALVLLVALIYFTIADVNTKNDVVNAVMFAALGAITWWYGDRPPAKMAEKFGVKQ